MQLYAYAVERFEQTIKQQGEPFEGELKAFRRINKPYSKLLAPYDRFYEFIRAQSWARSILKKIRKPNI